MSQPQSTDNLLAAKALFCERDERVLFADLDFTVSRGEVLQVEGPNGSGKTTLLKIISGLNRHFEGELYWQGDPLASVRDEFLSAMLYFGHLPGVKAVLNPIENLRWYAALHPAMSVDDESIMAALEKVGLYGFEDVACHALSAGQNRRVSLARLHLSQADLWILDEPFTAIDKAGVKAQEQLIESHAANGGAVILTTHHELSIASRQLNLGRTAGVTA